MKTDSVSGRPDADRWDHVREVGDLTKKDVAALTAYADSCLRRIWSRIRPADRQERAVDAEDVLQEALVAVASGNARCECPEKFMAFLRSVIRMKGWEQVRQLMERNTKTETEDETREVTADDGVTPLEYTEWREERAMLEEQIRASCSPTQGQVVVCVDLDGEKPKEVAADLGIEEATVWSHLSKGRAKVRDVLRRTKRRRPGSVGKAPRWSRKALPRRPAGGGGQSVAHP